MALLKPTTRRRDIPHEPGEWVEIRRLSSLGNLDESEMQKGRARRLTEMGRYFASAIVAWSYPEPPTVDAIAGQPNAQGEREGGLDATTALWLMGEINHLANGERTEEERFPSSSPSIAA
jgi:hypothetical protein